MKKAKIDIIPQESIESKIFSIRGKRVMFDRDLANLYQVNKSIKPGCQKEYSTIPRGFYVSDNKRRI